MIIHSLIHNNSSNISTNSIIFIIQSQVISPTTCLSHFNINCNNQRSRISNISYNPSKYFTVLSKINITAIRNSIITSILQTIRQSINQSNIITNSLITSIHNSQIILNHFTYNRSRIINSFVN